MFLVVIRIAILVLAIYLLYKAIRYLLNPKRSLELATDKKEFYFLDDSTDVKKNFYITYKGAEFEGKKELGITCSSFQIISVTIWVRQQDKLIGFNKKDFHFLEEKVKARYPNAYIQWQSPIREVLERP